MRIGKVAYVMGMLSDPLIGRCAGRSRGATYLRASHCPIASSVKNIAWAIQGIESGAVTDSIEIVLRNTAVAPPIMTRMSAPRVSGESGSNEVQLTFDGAFKTQVPDWSPDGSKIAYAAGDPGDVLAMDADGSDQHTVVGGSTDDFGPAWSPDGNQIAFIRFDNRTVHVVNADGSGEHIVRSLGLQAVPAWQPRGDRRP